VLAPGNRNVTITGLGASPSFGTTSIARGAVSFSVVGKSSAASFGSVAIQKGNVNFSVTGKSSGALLGNVSIVAGNRNLAITGKTSAAAFGSFSVTAAASSQAFSVTGLGSASSFGSIVVVAGVAVLGIGGLGSAGAFGTLVLTTRDQNVTITSLGSAAAFGVVSAYASAVTGDLDFASAATAGYELRCYEKAKQLPDEPSEMVCVYVKSLRGSDGTTGEHEHVCGAGTNPSVTTAKVTALASLNGFRRNRYTGSPTTTGALVPVAFLDGTMPVLDVT